MVQASALVHVSKKNAPGLCFSIWVCTHRILQVTCYCTLALATSSPDSLWPRELLYSPQSNRSCTAVHFIPVACSRLWRLELNLCICARARTLCVCVCCMRAQCSARQACLPLTPGARTHSESRTRARVQHAQRELEGGGGAGQA